MTVFVVNAGSSSVKAAYFVGDASGTIPREAAWTGEIAWTQLPARARLTWTTADSGADAAAVEIDGYPAAVTALCRSAVDRAGITPDIVAHRVVHGRDATRCTFIDARVRAEIEAATELAPLHNRAALTGIDVTAALFPAAAQAADFDTAFHRTLPDAAAAFALPYDWFAQKGWRRYGFHGISHRYCAQRTAEVLGRELAGLRIVSAHLGSGSSLAAIVDGKSVDTTMGFTPLDGVMMGTRSGSVDPGLVLYLLTSETYSASDLDTILNTKSGLAGVSQVSGDVREVIAAAERGIAQAQLALDMYVHRLAGGIASMAAACGGIDVLAFTGGVGEHSGYVRGRVCAALAFIGVALDERAPESGPDREIGRPRAAVRVTVINAREEYAIARDVARLRAPASA